MRREYRAIVTASAAFVILTGGVLWAVLSDSGGVESVCWASAKEYMHDVAPDTFSVDWTSSEMDGSTHVLEGVAKYESARTRNKVTHLITCRAEPTDNPKYMRAYTSLR